MGKISKQVSKGLGAAIQEVKAKIAGEENMQDNEQVESSFDVNDLLNAGVEAHNGRKKKKKETDELGEEKVFAQRSSFTYEETCENDFKNAQEKGLPDPDFDFRNYYEQGETVYYVNYSEILGEKEVVKVYLRTIYPRMMVGSEEKASCHCIGYPQRDNIFRNSKDANDFCNSLDISPRYSVKEPKLEQEEVTSDDN